MCLPLLPPLARELRNLLPDVGDVLVDGSPPRVTKPDQQLAQRLLLGRLLGWRPVGSPMWLLGWRPVGCPMWLRRPALQVPREAVNAPLLIVGEPWDLQPTSELSFSTVTVNAAIAALVPALASAVLLAVAPALAAPTAPIPALASAVLLAVAPALAAPTAPIPAAAAALRAVTWRVARERRAVQLDAIVAAALASAVGPITVPLAAPAVLPPCTPRRGIPGARRAAP